MIEIEKPVTQSDLARLETKLDAILHRQALAHMQVAFDNFCLKALASEHFRGLIRELRQRDPVEKARRLWVFGGNKQG